MSHISFGSVVAPLDIQLILVRHIIGGKRSLSHLFARSLTVDPQLWVDAHNLFTKNWNVYILIAVATVLQGLVQVGWVKSRHVLSLVAGGGGAPAPKEETSIRLLVLVALSQIVRLLFLDFLDLFCLNLFEAMHLHLTREVVLVHSLFIIHVVSGIALTGCTRLVFKHDPSSCEVPVFVAVVAVLWQDSATDHIVG